MRRFSLLFCGLLFLSACSGSEQGSDVIGDVTQDAVVVPDVDWCPADDASASSSGALPRPVVELSWKLGMVPAMESVSSWLTAVDDADEAGMAGVEAAMGLTRASDASGAGLAVYVHGSDEWAGVLADCAPAIPESDEAYMVRWSVDDAGNQVVHIVAPSAAGRLMAWKTVRQIPGRLAGTELFIADAPASKYRGVIETFYGAPYDEADRLAILPYLADMKFNQYIYAGKMDLYTDWLGPYWAQDWPAEYTEMLARLTAAVKAAGMTPGVQLRVGELSLDFTSDTDMTEFLKKIRLFRDLGFELFSLSFDDTQKVLSEADAAVYDSYDEANIDFSRRAFEAIHAEMPDLMLGWVPTDYWSAADTAATTLPLAGAQIPDYVSIGWTGNEVMPATITAADADRMAEWINRKPLLGDNYPVLENTGSRLFLGPLSGRSGDLAEHLDGIMFNPMPFPFASLPALATCADYAWNPAGYDPDDSLVSMSRMLGGSGNGERVLQFLAKTNQSPVLSVSMAPELTLLIDLLWEDWDAGQPMYTELFEEILTGLAELPALWAEPGPSVELRTALDPWVAQLGRYGTAGLAAISILKAIEAGSEPSVDSIAGFNEQMAAIEASDKRPTGDVMQEFLDRAAAIIADGPGFVWESGCEDTPTGASWAVISDTTFPRGPFIQMSDRNTVTVVWRTVAPTDQEGCVDFGWADQTRTECGQADANGQYEIKLDRLPAGTEIQYVARVGELSTANLTFRTMPDRPVPMKFAVFADAHNVEENLKKMSNVALAEGVDFAVSIGDMTGSGQPGELDTTFRGWQDLGSRVNIWAVVGNHDEKNIQTYWDSFVLPEGNVDEISTGLGEGWWARRVGDVWMGGGWIRDFYLSTPDTDWGEVGWFRKQFESEEFKTAKWKVFFIHQPAYSEEWDSECAFDGEDCLKVGLIPLLSEFGVQASFHGHMHGIEWGELGGVNMFTIGGLSGGMESDVCEPTDVIPQPWQGIYGVPAVGIIETGCDVMKVRIVDLDGNELAVVDVPEKPVHYNEDIKLLSFNLRMPFDSAAGQRWEDRKQPVLNVINEFEPDIMAVQEGYLDPMNFIKENIPGFDWIGEQRSQGFVDEYSAIFYKTDKFELIETETFALSDTPDVLGSKLDDEDQLYPRIVTWGHFRRLSDSFEFDMFATHWDHTGVDGIRERMAVITLQQMQQLSGGRPAFVAGDFNCGYQSVPYNVMTGAAEWEGVTGDLTDTWTELGLPEEGSFHGFTGTASGDRIDWIMHNDAFQAVSAGLIKTSYDGVYPSDHFPFGAEFSIVNK